MAQKIADRRDVDFVLHELLQVEELSEHEDFAEFNKKTINLIRRSPQPGHQGDFADPN